MPIFSNSYHQTMFSNSNVIKFKINKTELAKNINQYIYKLTKIETKNLLSGRTWGKQENKGSNSIVNKMKVVHVNICWMLLTQCLECKF